MRELANRREVPPVIDLLDKAYAVGYERVESLIARIQKAVRTDNLTIRARRADWQKKELRPFGWRHVAIITALGGIGFAAKFGIFSPSPQIETNITPPALSSDSEVETLKPTVPERTNSVSPNSLANPAFADFYNNKGPEVVVFEDPEETWIGVDKDVNERTGPVLKPGNVASLTQYIKIVIGNKYVIYENNNPQTEGVKWFKYQKEDGTWVFVREKSLEGELIATGIGNPDPTYFRRNPISHN